MYETKTKIVATLGPASWDEPMLTKLLDAGVDVFRINCSHADHDAIRRQIARVRRSAMQAGRPAAILLDLQGPKVRTGKVPEPLMLTGGDVLTVVMSPDYVGEGTRVGTTYPQMADDVSPGAEVLFADGALQGEVIAVRHETTPKEVDIRIDHGGELGSHKGINLPGVVMSIPALTEKDLADLEVGLNAGVDYVALSFVRTADDVEMLLHHMDALGHRAPIIAKIEKPQAVDNIDAILQVADGVMVARGDLGVEVRLEKVPVYQKTIIEAGFRAGKLVITATQMLDSMERNPRPTRAETTDVANAILDGTDAVMLSGETATGRYPVLAVRTMDRIAREVESSKFFVPTHRNRFPSGPGALGSILRAATFAAQESERALVVFTWTGRSAVYASKARLRQPIFALTPNPHIVDRLKLIWGVTPLLVPPVKSIDDLIASGEHVLLDGDHVTRGEEVVFVTGKVPVRGATNLLKIYRIGDE